MIVVRSRSCVNIRWLAMAERYVAAIDSAVDLISLLAKMFALPLLREPAG